MPIANPELMAFLYDLGLLSYVGSLGCFSVAYFAFADRDPVRQERDLPQVAGLHQRVADRHRDPRRPGVRLQGRAFAWNGSISFWMGTVVFGVWLTCVIMFLKKATELQPADTPPLD